MKHLDLTNSPSGLMKLGFQLIELYSRKTILFTLEEKVQNG
ncbi:hypothetical protein [Flagellimonas zhangzhouensis]|nr:hypothetical protein [Allomuricauda zhangzhouensis]